MKLKTFPIVFMVVMVFVAYFAYGFIQERYFNENEETPSSFENLYQNRENLEEAAIAAESPDENTVKEEKNIARDENGKPQLNKTDCQNSCENFKDNDNDLKYCQKICAIVHY